MSFPPPSRPMANGPTPGPYRADVLGGSPPRQAGTPGGADPWQGGSDPWSQALNSRPGPAPTAPATATSAPPPAPSGRPPPERTPPMEEFLHKGPVESEAPRSTSSVWLGGQPQSMPTPVPQAQAMRPSTPPGSCAGNVPQASQPTAPAAQPLWQPQSTAQASPRQPVPPSNAQASLSPQPPWAPTPQPTPAPFAGHPAAPAAEFSQPSPAPPWSTPNVAQPVPTWAPEPAPSAAQPEATAQPSSAQERRSPEAEPAPSAQEKGFQAAVWPCSQAKNAESFRTFSITVFRKSAEDRLGIRMEAVDGAGYDVACRVHCIFAGGLIDGWNRMMVANDMPDWAIKVDDVIAGINGSHSFTAGCFEAESASMLNLLIVRGLPVLL
mmetsp:Transcript_35206/g.81136  ORF Transcript_35206/g.81136 Transcript_35206/m.81136 type:complete len:381 (-) Transcript_35206:69-1211(-)